MLRPGRSHFLETWKRPGYRCYKVRLKTFQKFLSFSPKIFRRREYFFLTINRDFKWHLVLAERSNPSPHKDTSKRFSFLPIRLILPSFISFTLNSSASVALTELIFKKSLRHDHDLSYPKNWATINLFVKFLLEKNSIIRFFMRQNLFF